MDDERTIERLASSLGLRRGDVRYVMREKQGGCYHAIVLLFPAECSATSQTLADAINVALNIEAGLGNGALLDLFGARRLRFEKEAGWLEKLLALCNPHHIDKKYARVTRELAFAGTAAQGEETAIGKDQTAVIIITSCRRDGKPLGLWKHDANRTDAIIEVLEKHEEELRSIVRHASPSHHLIAAPLKEEKSPAMEETHPVILPLQKVMRKAPVFFTPESSSIKITV